MFILLFPQGKSDLGKPHQPVSISSMRAVLGTESHCFSCVECQSVYYGYHQDYYQHDVKNEQVLNILNQGVQETSHITWSIENYIQTPFEDVLKSNHPIYKAFMLIDRRLGRRRFEKIELSENEHPLVEEFYQLRKETFHSKGNRKIKE